MNILGVLLRASVLSVSWLGYYTWAMIGERAEPVAERLHVALEAVTRSKLKPARLINPWFCRFAPELLFRWNEEGSGMVAQDGIAPRSLCPPECYALV